MTERNNCGITNTGKRRKDPYEQIKREGEGGCENILVIWREINVSVRQKGRFISTDL